MTNRVLKDDTFSDLLVTKSLRLLGSFETTPSSLLNLVDTSTFIVDATDATKRLGFSVGGTTGTTTTLTTAPTANRAITLPDITGTVIVDAGAQTLSGAKTFSAAVTITPTTNQLVLGVTNTTTINSVAPAASRVYTIPDAGAAASFVMTEGAQTVNGAKTFGAQVVATLGVTSPLTAGYVYSGTLTASGATTAVAINSRVGTVTVTGVGDIAADATANAVFNNSLVTASTVGIVALTTTTAAAGSTPRIETVTFGVGTVTIAIRNSDPATATGAGANYTFSFILFN